MWGSFVTEKSTANHPQLPLETGEAMLSLAFAGDICNLCTLPLSPY